MVFVLIILLFLNFLIPYSSLYKDFRFDYRPKNTLKTNEYFGLFNDFKTGYLTKIEDSTLEDNCEVIHVGIVCSGYKSNLYLHTLLKSIYFYRMNPLHFHILVGKNSEKVLSTLFQTWSVPLSNVTFYNINDYVLDIRWIPTTHYSGIYGLLKLLFPKIIPLNITNKIIVLDTDLTFTSDILELWQLFRNFSKQQALGIVENQSDYYLGKNSRTKPWPALGRGFNSGVLLYYLDRLQHLNWPKLWYNITKQVASIYGTTRLGDQDIINAILVENPEILYQVPCYWNTQLSDHTLSYNCYDKYRIKVIHWNSPKKIQVFNKDGDYFRSILSTFLEFNGNLLRRQLHSCDKTTMIFNGKIEHVCAEFQRAQTSQWRTLLFFREYEPSTIENDVTFLAHFSFERLQMIEELVKYWPGPISLTLYVTDPEFQQSYNFIKNSEQLQERNNIMFHAVFRDGEYYPINILRNVGLRNIDTRYVFLADIDFMPMKNLYPILRKYLISFKTMEKTALIVPAFETQRYRSRIPKNKIQLLEMFDKKSVFPFRSDIWAAGHAPTNYTKWRTATIPYQVKWEPDFEPYVVVRSDVTEYDNRFMGFGWNKVSHIMELEAQGYEFTVLPNTFIIHKPHAPSYDIAKFRTSPTYRMCLQDLKEQFIRDLNRKYGRVFDARNSTFVVMN